jgi:hypothetical protein
LPVAVYGVGIVVFAAVIGAVAIMTVRTALAAEWTVAAVVGAFFLVFAYQLGTYFWRNRPSRYRPDAIPTAVLPRPRS